MRVLWVKAGKLLPVNTGGKIRSYNILRHLARNHQVTFLSYYGGHPDPAYESTIQEEFPGSRTIHTTRLDGNMYFESLRYLGNVLRPAPFSVSKFSDSKVHRLVESWIKEERFAVCLCDFLSASLNFPDNLHSSAVLFQHNVETSLWRRMASTESNPVKRLVYRIEAAKMARYERRMLRKFRHVIAVSEQDRRQMLEMDPSCKISVVPTGVDTEKYAAGPPSDANPPRIVFTGSMDWEPNIDAVIYFCKEIFPRILAELPSAIFQIVGRNPRPPVKQLAGPGVEVTGTVPSVAEYLRQASVVVVPLRIGGGTRLKIFEAMAMGKAMVSTSIGAEGLDVRGGRDLILADDAAAFAEAIILLVRNGGLRRQFENSAAKLAAQYDWSKIADRFADVLQNVSSRVTARHGNSPPAVHASERS